MPDTSNNNPAQERESTSQLASAPFEIAVLPLLNTTMFPGTVVPLAVGRLRSIKAVEAALATEEKLLACISVREGKDSDTEATPSDLYQIGTLVMIKRMMRAEDSLQIIVQGTERIKVLEWTQTDPHLRARVEIMPPLTIENAEEVEALQRNMQGLIQHALAMIPQVPPEVRVAVLGANDPTQLAYFLGSVLNLGVEQEQAMLEANTTDELLRISYGRLAREVEIMQIRSRIATEAQSEMDKAQRDYILRQQMRAIQKELGEDERGERGKRLDGETTRPRRPAFPRRQARRRRLRRLHTLPLRAPAHGPPRHEDSALRLLRSDVRTRSHGPLGPRLERPRKAGRLPGRAPLCHAHAPFLKFRIPAELLPRKKRISFKGKGRKGLKAWLGSFL